jgi:hypothetical protein
MEETVFQEALHRLRVDTVIPAKVCSYRGEAEECGRTVDDDGGNLQKSTMTICGEQMIRGKSNRRLSPNPVGRSPLNHRKKLRQRKRSPASQEFSIGPIDNSPQCALTGEGVDAVLPLPPIISTSMKFFLLQRYICCCCGGKGSGTGIKGGRCAN